MAATYPPGPPPMTIISNDLGLTIFTPNLTPTLFSRERERY
jgi:hypothetical protein